MKSRPRPAAARRSWGSTRPERRPAGSKTLRGARFPRVIMTAAGLSTVLSRPGREPAAALEGGRVLHEQTAAEGPREGGAEQAGGTRVERGLLVAIVLTMVLLPTLEAVLLRAVGGGVPDAIPYTTHLTLWVGFVGAMLATATGRHLALSTVDLLPQRLRTAARSYGHVVAALVMAVLAYASVKVIVADRTRIDTLAGGVPEWWVETIMPCGFAAMPVRPSPRCRPRRSAWSSSPPCPPSRCSPWPATSSPKAERRRAWCVPRSRSSAGCPADWRSWPRPCARSSPLSPARPG